MHPGEGGESIHQPEFTHSASDTEQNKVTAALVFFTYPQDLAGDLIYRNISFQIFCLKVDTGTLLKDKLMTPLHWEVLRSRHLHGLKWLQQFKASVTFCAQHRGAQEKGLFPGYTLF